MCAPRTATTRKSRLPQPAAAQRTTTVRKWSSARCEPRLARSGHPLRARLQRSQPWPAGPPKRTKPRCEPSTSVSGHRRAACPQRSVPPPRATRRPGRNPECPSGPPAARKTQSDRAVTVRERKPVVPRRLQRSPAPPPDPQSRRSCTPSQSRNVSDGLRATPNREVACPPVPSSNPRDAKRAAR